MYTLPPFTPWSDGMLPELQQEVTTFLDVFSRRALAMTCHALLVTAYSFSLSDVYWETDEAIYYAHFYVGNEVVNTQ